MNGHRGPGQAPGSDQSSLSLLVNAADAHDPPRGGGGGGHRDMAAAALGSLSTGRSLADTLRLRGLAGSAGVGNDGVGGGLPGGFDEQLLYAQQQAAQGGGGGGFGSSFLSQLRDQSILAQLGQQQQLAALLGLGGGNVGGGGAGNSNNRLQEMQAALAAAQLRQQHHQQQQHHHHQQQQQAQQQHLAQQQPQQQGSQLTHADLLALSRSGAFPGLSGLLGSSGVSPRGPGISGLSAADYESLQRLEELERRQRLLAASSSAQQFANPALSAASAMGFHSEQVPSPRPPNANLLRPPSLPTREESIDHHHHLLQQQQRLSVGTPPSAAVLNSNTNSVAAAKSSVSPRHGDVVTSKGPAMTPSSSNAAAAAAISADSNQDELEKTPGSVIVPCRARGMPMDHNFKTAYFVIPENVKHGEELICSYFACRNAGIKFRYCSHCKVPVAKRNFRKRHKHGGEDVGHLPGEDSGGEEDDRVGVNDGPSPHANSRSMQQQQFDGIPSQITANRFGAEAAEADGISSQSTDSENQKEHNYGNVVVGSGNNNNMHSFNAAASKAESGARQEVLMASMQLLANDGNNGISTAGICQPVGISDERQRRWIELLSKRPATDENGSMNKWLMEVLAVSDLNTSLLPVNNTTPATKAVAAPVSTTVAKSPAKAYKKGGLIARTASKDNASSRNDNYQGSPNQNISTPSTTAKASSLKKKRAVASAEKSDDQDEADAFAGGSFAKWKERKRQRKQSVAGGAGEGNISIKDQDSSSTGEKACI